jgi:hypothetical protein
MPEGLLDQVPAARTGMVDAFEEQYSSTGGIVQMPRAFDKMAMLQSRQLSSPVNQFASVEFAAGELITVENYRFIHQLLFLVNRHDNLHCLGALTGDTTVGRQVGLMIGY